jgi:hypothetical protein
MNNPGSKVLARFVSASTLLLIVLLPLSVGNAQGRCKVKLVKVKGLLAGKVFLNRGGEREPLNGVAIDILDQRERRLVSSASSAEDGSYMVKGLEPGNYIIKTTHMIAVDFEVELEVAKSEKEEADRLVNLILGIDKEKECGGGRVETEKVK